MPESIGTSYPTKIPTYEEAADIKAALKLYHYGTTTPGTVEPQSIAGHLGNLQAQITAIPSLEVVDLGVDENLNNYIEAGYFHQASNANARSTNSANYPTFGTPSQAYAGMLTVLVGAISQDPTESFIYQIYQMTGGDVGPDARFWRTRTGAPSKTWSSWKQVSDSTHSHPTLYYSKTEVDSLLNLKEPSINLTADKALVSNTSGDVAVSAVSKTQLEYIKDSTGTTGTSTSKLVFSDAPSFTGSVTMGTPLSVTNGGTGGSNKATARTGIGIYVQDPANGNPVGANAGDIWLW